MEANLFKNILNDVKVDLTDEFHRNFERKAFFDRPWKKTKHANARGSLMMRSGALRRSIRGTIEGKTIKWSSSLPYASIHNQGGEITVTPKMIKYFWAMYYKTSGAVSGGNTQRNLLLSAEAEKWKFMALMKVGSKIKIEQRQFIGSHPQVRKSVERAVDANIKEFDKYLKNKLKR